MCDENVVCNEIWKSVLVALEIALHMYTKMNLNKILIIMNLKIFKWNHKSKMQHSEYAVVTSE